MEILAPVGSWECLEPAVRCGCDAVYLGGSRFSARGFAKNFDGDLLADAVKYCHGRGVKVYQALNTLLRDEELPLALRSAEYACEIGVDALIVQDVGLATLVHQMAPEMRLHASTQMSVHTPAGVELLAEMGFQRVVLSRELSLREIEEIARRSPIELEVFVHGALCMSVSGQCYFSALLGSRSGNRGLCAQTCRLPFAAPNGTGHDLSLKDLSGIGYWKQLEELGVASAKIEGRMKRPEYVAAAVSACRHAADGEEVPPSLNESLRAVFSRSGFTQDYLEGKLGRELFGIRSKEDVTSATSDIFGELRTLYRAERQNIPVSVQFTLPEEGNSTLTVAIPGKAPVTVTGQPGEIAQKRPLDEERALAQLTKTGGTPFFAKKAQCTLAPGMTLPISELNRMRREGLEALQASLEQVKSIPWNPVEFSTVSHRSVEKTAPVAVLSSLEQLVPEMKVCRYIFLPLSTPLEQLTAKQSEGYPVAVEIPRGMFGQESAIRTRLQACKEAGIFHVRVNNLGALALVRRLDMIPHGGFGLNLFNTPALEWAKSFGLADAELSFELTLEQAKKLGGDLPRGIFSYGRLPLMLTRNCPIKNGRTSCAGCDKQSSITDRKGISFPVRCNGGCSEILNSVPLDWLDRQNEYSDLELQFLHFTVENSVESVENFTRLKSKDKPKGEYTRGLYSRGVE